MDASRRRLIMYNVKTVAPIPKVQVTRNPVYVTVAIQ
jgi:hypothetical protein